MDKSSGYKYKRVMIVDDNEIDRYIGERTSRQYHIAEDVISMESATDALKYLSSLAQYPDLLPEVIFLDINMPEMNGFEFLEEYQNLPDSIKRNCIVVMLTTSTHPEDKERADRSPYVKGYLNKPLSYENFKKI
jgi:CheY-like chemotaxis protein